MLHFRGSIDVRFMKYDAELSCEIAAELEIFVRLRASQSVMQMGRMQNDAQLAALLVQRAQQRDRIRTTGKAYP